MTFFEYVHRGRVAATIAAASLVTMLVGCSSDETNATAGGTSRPAAGTSAQSGPTSGYENPDIVPTPGSGNYLSCGRWTNAELGWASWHTDEKYPPSGVVVLTDEFDLPAGFAPMATRTRAFGHYVTATFHTDGGLTQYQDKTVGVLMGTNRSDNLAGTDATMDLAVVSQDGRLVSHRQYAERENSLMPESFDLVEDAKSGYYRIEAEDGITIPAEANGNKDSKQYALSILPDAFDERTLWVLMRGSAKLYKAKLFYLSVEFPSILPYLDKCDA